MAKRYDFENDDFEAQMLQASAILDQLERNSRKPAPAAALQSASNIIDSTADQAPQDFSFPFPPYPIQSDFMAQLFRTIETSHVGIFESPTGTGKSLSLLCGSLTWLRMDEEKRRKEFDAILREQQRTSNDDDWIQAFAQKEESLSKHRDFLDRQRQLQQREKVLLQWKKDYRALSSRFGAQKRKSTGFGAGLASSKEDSDEGDGGVEERSEEDSMLLDDYNSDTESKATSTSAKRVEEDVVDTPKVIYCSRTHSQLAQFLSEIKKTTFAKEIRCVTLGSRQTFCINETVRKGNQVNLINERCLQLQKEKLEKSSSKKDKLESCSTGKGSAKGCPFYKRTAVDEFSNSILLNGLRDVENLITEAKETKACPYYATRRAVAAAQLVLTPYQILLHKPTREACGLKLEGNVLIIDEAHNLLDTISNIHSTEINIMQLESAHLQLQRYLQRFSSRLNPKNLMYIRQLGVVLDGLTASLKKSSHERVFALTDFVFFAGIDTVNMFKLLRYVESSHISQKLNAYVNRFLQETSVDSASGNSLSPFHTVQSFLRCLVQRAEDGRVILTPSGGSNGQQKYAKLKFIHLNPAVYFKDLCTNVRSVILAGGTMEPVSDLIDQLFTPCGIQAVSIDRFSCGHIVDDENLLPLILDKGPSGVTFDFTLANRNDEGMIKELGRLLTNLANVVPGGIVCFFQSYDYESTVYQQWNRSGILDGLEKKKKVFREPARASDVNAVLESFARSAKSSTGALMLAVVGGKLSEGINFTDDLGRVVIMVGLPFPNSHSIELKEKMRFLCERSGDDRRGNEYYENLCMKAVNQSIGRVIRHRHDYAAILLLDKGYGRPAIQKKLPSWISKLVTYNNGFGPCFGKIKQFFTKLGVTYPKKE